MVRFDEARSFGTLMGASLSDPSIEPPYSTRLALEGSSAMGQVARTGDAVMVGAGADDACVMMPGYAVASAMATPLSVDNRLWGTLVTAFAEPRSFAQDEMDRLTRLGEIATLAIASSDARAQLATLASTDHLTGLWNRRAFQERLDVELMQARRNGRDLSMVVMDLDHFKLVNDTHGHPAGDRVLIEVARRLFGMVREGETVARVGGEEFAWVLPGTPAIAAVSAAERVRAAIGSQDFPDVGRLTVSIGVCGLEEAQGGADLFRLADVALYWAKAQGRDRVVRYTPDTIDLLSTEETGRRLGRAKSFASVHALARAVDAKDPSTQRHSERVAGLARDLALRRGWPAEEADRLHAAGLVHDVGKIAIADAVLLKPGPLSAVEFEQVKEHARIGATMLQGALAPDQVSWVRAHHERYDGSGYPDGLAGDRIHEGARLLALADAWDAMTVSRPYGAPRSDADALAECRRMSGSQFDPDAVEALEKLLGARAAASRRGAA